MGGLTVARMSADAEVEVACVRPKGKWPLLLAIPDQALSTEQARRVLPTHYSRADAVVEHSEFDAAARGLHPGTPRLAFRCTR